MPVLTAGVGRHQGYIWAWLLRTRLYSPVKVRFKLSRAVCFGLLSIGSKNTKYRAFSVQDSANKVLVAIKV